MIVLLVMSSNRFGLGMYTPNKGTKTHLLQWRVFLCIQSRACRHLMWIARSAVIFLWIMQSQISVGVTHLTTSSVLLHPCAESHDTFSRNFHRINKNARYNQKNDVGTFCAAVEIDVVFI